MKKQYLCILMLISIFLISSCASTASSMEFRSAKTAVRSEKNLKKGEEWGLQALEMELHATDASVPYFLAIEIYKPQKRWGDMASMLDEAMKRNPEQKLERPIVLDEVVITTINEAVNVYKEELWVNVYNGALSFYEKGSQDKAMDQFLLALNIDPSRISTYIVLAKFYKEDNNLDKAHSMLEDAFKINKMTSEDKAELLLIKAELYRDEGDSESALAHYEMAYSETESITSILSILQLHLLNENYLKAIEWGEVAMKNRMKIDRNYYKDLLYNVALAYRGAGSVYYDQGVDVIESRY